MLVAYKNQVLKMAGDYQEMKKAVNDTGRCVACGVCALQCSRGAISIYRGCYADVNISMCVGCGICEKACPAGSIVVRETEDTGR